MRARADAAPRSRSGGSPPCRPSVRAPLVDRDLLADEVLVDGVGRLLDVLLVCESLTAGSPSAGARRPGTAARSRRGCDRRRRSRFAERSSFESCSASVSSRRLDRELLTERALDGCEPLPSRGSRRSSARTCARFACRPRSSHRDRRRQTPRRARRRPTPASRMPVLGDRARTASPWAASSSAVSVDVDPLRLADLRRAAPRSRRRCLPDLGVGELERLEDRVLGNLVCRRPRSSSAPRSCRRR